MGFKKRAIESGLLVILLGLASCGGGSTGGGGSDFGFNGTGFGFSEIFGNTTGAGTSREYPILDGQNLPVVLYFNEDIDPASVNSASINVVTIDVPDEEDPDDLVQVSGGIQAKVNFVVDKSNLYIVPTLSFTPEGAPDFGFVPHAAYEIKFTQPPGSDVVTSVSGKKLVLPQGNPVAFITTDSVYDWYPGAPEPSFYWFNDVKKSWVELKEGKVEQIPIQPLSSPMFRVYFSEPVQLAWGDVVLVNSTDNTSDALEVVYELEVQPGQFVPVPVPGSWFFVQTSVEEVYVEFWPNGSLVTLPDVDAIELAAWGMVSDLAGNTKGTLAGKPYDIRDYRTLEPVGTPTIPFVLEEFLDNEQEDQTATSADWNAPGTEGYLALGGGGGNGSDGKFFPPNEYPKDPKLGVVLDTTEQIVYLPTVIEVQPDVWEPYEYNFSSFRVPFGWTVKVKDLTDDALPAGATVFPPLDIKVTGTVLIEGTLDVSGKSGEDAMVGLNPDGSDGGRSYAGGAMGGRGGSVPSGGGTHTVPLGWDFNGLYGAEPPNNPSIEGISGIITDLGNYYLEDLNVDFYALMPWIEDQMIQPNVGMGPDNSDVVTNHPTFYVKTVLPGEPNRIYIHDDPNHPKYRGKFTAPSKNPGLPPPPIAVVGDSYLVGYLRGEDGNDATVFDRGGKGGDPLTVAQTILTLAAAGSGGGGGGSVAGSLGRSYLGSSTTMGGNSLPESKGGDGGGIGVLSGSVVSVDSLVNQLEVDQELSWDLTGYRINPNHDDQVPETTNDWIFEIVSNTQTPPYIIEVEPLKNGLKLGDPEVGADIGTPFILYPPEDLGGSGGGGTGMELSGTYKTTFQPPFQLPRWLNGAGGGAGGGVLILESAHQVEMTANGKILANGGRGGILTGSQVTLPGGGGGSGGTVIIRSKENIQVAFGGLISAEGGAGNDDGDTPEIKEGQGGDGFVRLENSANDLLVEDYTNTVEGWSKTIPPVTEKDLGTFIPDSQESLGQSLWYPSGLIKPSYDAMTVYYEMTVDGEEKTGLFYRIDGDSQVSGQYTDPPFEILFNGAQATPETGNLDANSIDEIFLPWADFNDENKPFFRFKVKMLAEVQGIAGTYTQLKIDGLQIEVSQ